MRKHYNPTTTFDPVATMNGINKFDTFGNMMTNVTSSRVTSGGIEITTLPHKPTQALFARQIAAQTLAQSNPEYLSLDFVHALKPNEIVAFKRPGIQDNVFRQLRLGKNEVHARLDLHKFTLDEARNALLSFLKQSQDVDILTIIIVHGKGEHSSPSKSMKSFVCQWLEQVEDVQCFHSAQRHQGGTGAVYVLLKKSQGKKGENRERKPQTLSE